LQPPHQLILLCRLADPQAGEVVAGQTDVGEQAGGVLVEVQEGPGFQIERPARLLLQAGQGAHPGQQRLQRVQRGGARVFHGLLLKTR
jgi:hypothetical protein